MNFKMLVLEIGSFLIIVMGALFYMHQHAAKAPVLDTAANSATSASTEYIRTSDDGRNTGSLSVTQRDPNIVHITGEAFWGANPNYGTIDTDVILTDDKGTYTIGDGENACALDFTFTDTSVTVVVRNLQSCQSELTWGTNVDFSGEYSKAN